MHFHMLAMLAQFERRLIQERVTAGLSATRKQGRVGGRVQADQHVLAHARILMVGGMSPSQAAKTARVSRFTLNMHGVVRKTGSRRHPGH
jgi:DNA invertase Pin-like site-specific DNA recombinase